MRIAYVCTDRGVPPFGRKGSSVHVQSVIRALRRRGADVTLLATRPGRHVPPDLSDLEVIALPKPPKELGERRERAALAANRDLRRALRRAGPFDAVYERFSLFTFAAMEYAKFNDIPGLLEVNAPLVREQGRYRSLVLHVEAEAAAARSLAAARHILAVSRGVAEAIGRDDPAPHRIEVVPNAVDPERFDPAVARSMPSRDAVTVGFVGTLKPWHGVETLLEAFSLIRHRCAGMRLLVVGDGNLREALQARARALAIDDSVIWTGAVDPDDVPGLLASMDVVTAPYPILDGFYFSPLKLFEYMAAGRAIAAPAIGQIADVLEDGHTGVLYPPGDVAALANAIARLAGDTDLRRRLGDAARDVAQREHTWDAVARRILALITLRSRRKTDAQGVC